ncbi:MAG: hypothetical protein ACJAS3_000855 [Roseivirga sp.]
MTHVNVHQGRSRKEVFGLGRDYSYSLIAQLPYMSCGGDTRNSVANNYDVLHSWIDNTQDEVFDSGFVSLF